MPRERMSDLTGLRGARLSPAWAGIKALVAVAVATVALCALLGRCSVPVQEAPHPATVRTR